MLFLSSVCFTNINLIQPWLTAACSSSQMGLAAPPGTYTTLQGRLYGGRCCLGEDLAQACAESMYFSGSLYRQNNYSGQRVIYNCPPATGFLREDVGMSTAIPCAHTATHTTALSLFNACRILLWHKSWGLFSKEVTFTGGKKNAAPTTVSPHLTQKPGGLPTNCHNFFMNSSGLTAWLSLWPYKKTLMLMWLHSLWLALDSPPLRKQPPCSFWNPYRSGEKDTYSWKTQGSNLSPCRKATPTGCSQASLPAGCSPFVCSWGTT